MLPAEIEPSEEQSQRASQVLSLLREGVGQAGESSHLHTDCEIVSLDYACADTLRVGVAVDYIRCYVHHYGWRVPMISILRSRIDFNQLGKVYFLVSKLMNDGVSILRESICGHLKVMVGCRSRQLLSEKPGIAKCSPAQMPSKNQLGIPLESNECVSVSDFIVKAFDFLLCLLFDFYKGPDFVTLHVSDGYALNALV